MKNKIWYNCPALLTTQFSAVLSFGHFWVSARKLVPLRYTHGGFFQNFSLSSLCSALSGFMNKGVATPYQINDLVLF